ncbi:MAG: hypothetical protein ACKOBN_04225 [Flavobacteriales bacterium]
MRAEEQLLGLRPTIEKQSTEFTEQEHFQNTTLRPILKFQHEIWLMEWQQNTLFHSVQVLKNDADQRKLLQSIFSKNTGLIQRYIGMVTGFFTELEYQFYLTNKNQIDKRIKELLLTRLLSY